MERDQIVKVVIIGNASVGKSNILARYVNNEFGNCEATIGC
jgi:GTPase SAR1 family protein